MKCARSRQPSRGWRWQGAMACGVFVTLAGCASLSTTGGADRLDAAVTERGLPPVRLAESDAARSTAASEVEALLAQPLSEGRAVQIALLNHRGLQSQLATLGVADAERVQLSRWPNPGFTFKRTRQDDIVSIERTLTFGLMDLITLPARSRLGEARFEEVRAATLDTLLTLVADTRRAWVDAVATDVGRRYAAQVVDAADAARMLAEEMQRAGNWSPAMAARESAFEAEARIQALRADQAAIAARERLVRLLGLSSPDRVQLPDRLPDLPSFPSGDTMQPAQDGTLDEPALMQRPDVAVARQRLDQLAEELGIARTSSWWQGFEMGLVHNTATGSTPARGVELHIDLPLFDLGDARRKEAEHRLTAQAQQLAQTFIDARSDIRERRAARARAQAVAAQYRDGILPRRQQIATDALRRYNGMLIGVFDLLADAREQIAAATAAQEALRDFWIADIDYRQALGGRDIQGHPTDSIPPADTPAPAPAHPETHHHD